MRHRNILLILLSLICFENTLGRATPFVKTNSNATFSWFESGTVFSEFVNDNIVNCYYYAAGKDRLRTLDLTFQTVDKANHNQIKRYRINYYKLLSENLPPSQLEAIHSYNYKKLLPKSVFNEESPIFKIHNSVVQLNTTDPKNVVSNKIYTSKSTVLDVHVNAGVVFVLENDGITTITGKNVSSKKIKWPAEDLKIKKIKFNKNHNIGFLTTEFNKKDDVGNQTLIIDLESGTVLKTFNNLNTVEILDNSHILAYSKNSLSNFKVLNFKTSETVFENTENRLENHDIIKVVDCNNRFIALEVLRETRKLLIFEKSNGALKKTIEISNNDPQTEIKKSFLTGFDYPYLYFSNKRTAIESLFNDQVAAYASIPNTTNRGSKSKTVNEKISEFNYKALLIANENYTNDINTLEFPVNDSERLKKVLEDHYDFKSKDIVHLKDATRFDIINTLDSLVSSITEQDNLLIFYAGHGVYDENLKKGYWLPVDASASRKNNWVSNSDIRDYIAAFKSQHTLLISDACFSGSIFEYKQRSLNKKEKAVTEKLLSKKSRKAMTSGLNKSVPDKSIFIKYLIKELNSNKKPYLRAGELYNDIREAVMANTDNNPQFEVIKNAEHEGGEFIFLKR